MSYRKWRKKILSMPYIEDNNLSKRKFGENISIVDKNKKIINFSFVRADLPKRVKRHVSIHERIHANHPKFGEFRTNLAAFSIDPIGWFSTVIATIKSKERRKLYMAKIKRTSKKH